MSFIEKFKWVLMVYRVRTRVITTTATTVLWPLYRSCCELEDSVGAKFYCIHALAGGI